MKKRMVNLVLAIGLIVSMVTVPVSAAGNGEEQGEKPENVRNLMDYPGYDDVTDEWAAANGWSKNGDNGYLKTVDGILYNLDFRWTYWEQYLDPKAEIYDPHWFITVKDGKDAAGVVEIPGSIDGYPVLTIGSMEQNAFINNNQITEVIMAEGVQEIAYHSFYNCDSLTKVIMPESLLYIDVAFVGNDSLKELTIPASVKWVVWSSFNGVALEKITFEGNAPQFLNGRHGLVDANLTINRNTEVYRYSNTVGWDNDNWKNGAAISGTLGKEYKSIHVIENGDPPVVEASAVKVSQDAVSVKAGESATVIATVEPDNAADKTVTWTSANPEIATVNNGTITGVAAGTTTITAVCGKASASVAVTVTANEPIEPTDPEEPDNPDDPAEPEINLPFTDVPKGAWFYGTVADVYEKGLMTGLTDTIFGPNDKLARAQFATILWRMEDEPAVAFEQKFPDVPDSQFYTKAVLWAADAGIVTGYTDTGKFGPGDNINREQMAVMMFRYADYLGLDTSQRADFSSYPDAANVNSFAKDAMSWCVANGIITGDNGKLNPQAETVRAVCATIISRFCDTYGL